jgi:transmembrane sensor
MESSLKIEETASDWIIKRGSEEWSAEDQVELDRWLAASTANKVAFIRLETAWRKAHRLNALAGGAPPGVVPPPGEWKFSPFFDSPSLPHSAPQQRAVHRAPARRMRFLGAAAGIVGAALISGWYLLPQGTAYRTEIGGLQAVLMNDGSRITLNTDSRIRVAVSETERRVNLEQGEAFFDVAKDPKRPFVVNAGKQRIVAVGTAFSVRRRTENDSDDVLIVVTEGAVRVEQDGVKPQATQLAAGTIARTNDKGTQVQTRPLAAAEEQLSWRAGYLVFRETALVDAVGEFNRYNTRKMVVEDPGALGSVHVGGTFRPTNVDAFVRFLEQGFEMEAARTEHEIRLRKR